MTRKIPNIVIALIAVGCMIVIPPMLFPGAAIIILAVVAGFSK